MTQFPHIDIAVRRIHQRSVSVLYSTCEASSLPAFFSPLSLFIYAEELFVVGRQIGLLTFSLLQVEGPETATEYIIRVSALSAPNGSATLHLLKSLAATPLSTWQDPETATRHLTTLVKGVGMPSGFMLGKPSGAASFKMGSACLCSYLSEEDLTEILGQPFYEGFEAYQYVIAAEATVVIMPGVSIARVATPEPIPQEELAESASEALSLTLLLDFSDGYVIEHDVEMESSSQEYHDLRQGRFHGFPATKEPDQPGHNPTWRVEVKATMPSFDISLPSSQATAEETQTSTSTTSATTPITVSPLEELEEELLAEPQRKRRSMAWVWISLIVIVAVLVAWALVNFLPSIVPTSSYDEMELVDVSDTPVATISEALPTDSIVSDSVALDSVAPVAASPATNTLVDNANEKALNPASSLEAADVAYLNSHTVWQRSQLKSDKYQSFFDLFAKGDIDAIARADYFYIPGQATNTTALKMIDMLWRAYKSPVQVANERVLRQLKGKEQIDLPQLYDTLARYRDNQPNTTPRPQRAS
ncbi:MAG: hypothetical protein LIO90_07140 [Bacteroidales bacterium]|nr:hypothetical protein [Bacteroidales bacterium]